MPTLREPELIVTRGAIVTAGRSGVTRTMLVIALGLNDQPPLPARQVILTTNRGIAEWDAIFDDTIVAVAILDRLLHHPTVVQNVATATACAATAPASRSYAPGSLLAA